MTQKGESAVRSQVEFVTFLFTQIPFGDQYFPSYGLSRWKDKDLYLWSANNIGGNYNKYEAF